jgi:hypothetical protein
VERRREVPHPRQPREGTKALAEAPRRPRILVQASAIGVYGSRGDEEFDETSTSGAGFLADVGRAWESASAPAEAAGVRVVRLRFGLVVSPRGGALRKMLLPFRMGAGGRVGPGTQWMSWISIDDALGAIHHALKDGRLSGPLNAVAPAPVTNAEFTRALGRALGRPTIFPMPAFAARLAFGELADALLLASQRVLPKRLQETGYRFREPDIDTCLRRVLGREGP